MNRTDGFYTLRGYQNQTSPELTSAMEDYLEMICRVLNNQGTVRVNDLSDRLHVKPSSVSKMIRQLCMADYVKAEKYGEIHLTEKGREAGGYLLYRHDVIHRFLCVLNNSSDELEQVEKIEHFLNCITIENLAQLTKRLTSKDAVE